MEPTTEFIVLAIISSFGCILIIFNRRGLVDKAWFEFVGYLVLIFPPLVPLVQVIFNSGLDKGWYLAPYLLVGIGCFAFWLFDAKGAKKTRTSYIVAVSILSIWIIFGLLIFQKIIS